MTQNELQAILRSDKKLTVKEVENIIYQLKEDTNEFQDKMLKNFDAIKDDAKEKQRWISNYGFYNGERNAFYICLDLLNKVGENETSVAEDIKTALKQAIEYEKGEQK